jgi:hypothetical protein
MKQSSKRILSVFFAFILIVTAFIFFFDFVQPTYNDMQALRSKQLGEASYLQNQTALVKQVQMTLNTYQNETQGAANVSLAMPSGQDVAGALAQIQGIAANNAIALGSVALTLPTVQIQASGSDTSGGSSAAELMKPLGSFELRFAAAGSYESFKNFLSEVETNIRIFDVENISIQPAVVVSAPAASTKSKAAASTSTTPADDLFNYAVTVATYYQTQ